MADGNAFTVNDVIVSKVHDRHQRVIVTPDPSDRLLLPVAPAGGPAMWRCAPTAGHTRSPRAGAACVSSTPRR